MRRYLGCTPTEFINDARLRYARWMLENSSFSEGEISAACGFSDLPYFCRKFRDKYEQTPTEIRASKRGGFDQYAGPTRAAAVDDGKSPKLQNKKCKGKKS
jgi:AraC-like DNA-binding protein